MTDDRPPVPPFDRSSALLKVQAAEDAWNTRDPQRVSLAYTEDSTWRNRDQFLTGRTEIVEFLTAKWERELDYVLRKNLWGFDGDRIAVRFQYEWRDAGGQERSDSGDVAGGQERSDSGDVACGQERSDSGDVAGGQERSDSGDVACGQERSDPGDVATGQWYRSYGNELWEFDEHGLMRRREASINDVVIDQADRRYFGARSEDERAQDIPLR